MSDKYPPILEVPVSESARNLKEVTVTLLYDEPKEFEGKYGTQYRYSVQLNGVEHTLFASGALHKRIQEQSPGKGTQLSIARFGTGKETKWDVVVAGGPTRSKAAQAAPQASPQGSAPRRTPQAFVEALSLYWDAFDFATAQLAARNLQPNADINAVAFVIYKLAQDHGVTDINNPLAPTPSTTDAAEVEGKNKMLTEITNGFARTNLSEDHYLDAINLHVEDEKYTSVNQMTREVGLAVWATIKNVENGVTTWNDIIFPEDLPF